MTGAVVSLDPSWSDAVELYIKVNKAEKKRESVKEQKWELSTRNLLQSLRLQMAVSI